MQNLVLLIFLVLLSSCQPVQNYLDSDYPKYEGDFRSNSESETGSVKVVTWNTHYSLKINQTIEELQTTDVLNETGLLLLQEVDESSVQLIAQTFHYEYIYYPANIHKYHGNNFGNAVLSKWPILETNKVILPNKKPKNNQKRIAVKAVVEIGSEQISVYSVHTETSWMSWKKRKEQYEFLVSEIGKEESNVIIGGDFNTLTNKGVRNLENLFAKVGLTRTSKGAGYSVTFWGFKFPMDHIFSRNFRIIENGVWYGTSSSDHNPVWVILEFEE